MKIKETDHEKKKNTWWRIYINENSCVCVSVKKDNEKKRYRKVVTQWEGG